MKKFLLITTMLMVFILCMTYKSVNIEQYTYQNTIITKLVYHKGLERKVLSVIIRKYENVTDSLKVANYNYMKRIAERL